MLDVQPVAADDAGLIAEMAHRLVELFEDPLAAVLGVNVDALDPPDLGATPVGPLVGDQEAADELACFGFGDEVSAVVRLIEDTLHALSQSIEVQFFTLGLHRHGLVEAGDDFGVFTHSGAGLKHAIEHNACRTRYTGRMRTAVSILLGLLLLTVGCQSAPQAESIENLSEQVPVEQMDHFAFASEKYSTVFEAAVQALRDQGFRIARRDYRFGAITTYPKEAATAAEFWIDDASTLDQRLSDTLNAQQRLIKIQISDFNLDAALSGTSSGGSVDRPTQTYYLMVEVLVQRLQRPERHLTHSASPRISRTYTDTPMHLKDRGIDGPYAQDLDRDTSLEQRLLKVIRSSVKG